MSGRFFFLLFLIAASVAVSVAQADERWTLTAEGAAAFSLRAPGWVLSFDSHPAQLVPFPAGAHEVSAGRRLSFRLSGAPPPASEGWRMPLNDSTFLSFEATFRAAPLYPMPPGLVRPALQAVVGLGIEF